MKFDQRSGKFDPVRSNDESPDSSDVYTINRLINLSATAEGPTVPPPVLRGTRILPPTNFKITRQEELDGATRFILTWLNRPEYVKFQPQYKIYTFAQNNLVKFQSGQNVNSPEWDGPLQSPVTTMSPPCEVIVRGHLTQPVVFGITTRLSNGLENRANMPTVSAACAPIEHHTRRISATYSCVESDEVVWCDATAGAFAVTLMSVLQVPVGRIMYFKNLTPATNVTITPHAGETIDGAATLVINAGGANAILIADRPGLVWRTNQ